MPFGIPAEDFHGGFGLPDTHDGEPCPVFSADQVTKYFVSYCENCGEPIFEYDTYFVATLSEKEIYFCMDCCREG